MPSIRGNNIRQPRKRCVEQDTQTDGRVGSHLQTRTSNEIKQEKLDDETSVLLSQRVQDAVENGDFLALQEMISSISAPMLSKIRQVRLRHIQTMMEEIRSIKDLDARQDAVHAIEHRMKIEHDLAAVLELLHRVPERALDDVELQSLLNSLHGLFKTTRQTADFTQTFPQSPKFYLIVAAIGHRLISILDGHTEFDLQKTTYPPALTEQKRLDVAGQSTPAGVSLGFICFTTIEAALSWSPPPNSRLLHAPKVLVEVSCPELAVKSIETIRSAVLLPYVRTERIIVRFGQPPYVDETKFPKSLKLFIDGLGKEFASTSLLEQRALIQRLEKLTGRPPFKV